MSATLDAATKTRLLEHLAYYETVDFRETEENPNNGGAENHFMGTKHELKSVVKFYPTSQNFLDEQGDPIRLPQYLPHRNTFLMACVTDPNETTSKVNVYGVYKINGIKDIIRNSREKDLKLEWKAVEISNDLVNELWDQLQILIKNKKLHLPTLDYEKLSEEEKEAKQYNRITIQKVPVPSASRWCSVS